MPLPPGFESSDPRLGRLPQYDPRNTEYPIRTLIPPTYAPRSYTWRCAPYLNQGNVGACVGFAIAHEIAARPVEIPTVVNDLGFRIYHDAQQLDEWPGDAYEGTSVLAGIKAGKALGYYEEYRWAFTLEDVVLTLGYKGPVVLGVNWYTGMMTADGAGMIHVSGQVEGGHAILAKGVNIKTEMIRLHNSWGTWWGRGGDALISFEDVARLLRQSGDACIPIRRLRP